MMRLLLLAALVLPSLSLEPVRAPEAGPLVVVGGGGTPDAVVARTLALAGGAEARVVVLPQASSRDGRGLDTAEMWRSAGARDVVLLDGEDAAEMAAELARADLVWFPGGSQNRLLEALRGLELVDDVLAARARGAVVGGTSAGAAVLSDPMITGEADLESVTAGATALAAGLGLWEGVIVDQHFVARRRHNRLLSAVLDTGRVGIGVDERTAALVRTDGSFEVLGEGVVVVLDPRGAELVRAKEGERGAGTGLSLHVLRGGMTLDLTD